MIHPEAPLYFPANANVGKVCLIFVFLSILRVFGFIQYDSIFLLQLIIAPFSWLLLLTVLLLRLFHPNNSGVVPLQVLILLATVDANQVIYQLPLHNKR